MSTNSSSRFILMSIYEFKNRHGPCVNRMFKYEKILLNYVVVFCFVLLNTNFSTKLIRQRRREKNTQPNN